MRMKLILEKACSNRGADMGRPNRIPADANTVGKLHLVRLQWVDGDYDEGGAYWGRSFHNYRSDYIYCCYGETKTEQLRIFVRAFTRDEAKAEVKRTLLKDNPKFYR